MRYSQIPLRQKPLQDLANWVNGDFPRSFGFVFILLLSGDAVPEGLRTPQRTHVVSTQGSSDTVLAPTLGTGLSFQEPEPVVWQVTEAHGGWRQEPGGACQAWGSVCTTGAQLRLCRWAAGRAAGTWGRPVQEAPRLRAKGKGFPFSGLNTRGSSSLGTNLGMEIGGCGWVSGKNSSCGLGRPWTSRRPNPKRRVPQSWGLWE